MNWTIGGQKVLLGFGSLAAASLVSLVAYNGIGGTGHPSTRVLAEKIAGSGAGSTAGGSTAASSASSSGKANGNGNGNDPKSFSIAVDNQQGPLGPGVISGLVLKITNTGNQDIRVDGLSATLQSITPDINNHAAGTCTAANSGFQIQPWTGQQFTVVKNGGTATSSPGYIPVTLGADAPDACQGATFNLSFAGTAVKA